VTKPRRGAPAHWHFWRAGFWTRPALIVFYSILAGLGGLVLLVDVPGNFNDAREMLDAPVCSPTSQSRCLERVPTEIEGPYAERGPGSEWLFYSTRGEGRRLLGEADISTYGSSKLKEGDRVDALLWEGEIVALLTESGDRIDTEAFGHAGWIVPLGLSLFALAGALVGVQIARVKRMGARGWWSTSSETSGAFLPPSPFTLYVGAVMLGGVTAPLAIAFGMEPLTAGLLGVAVLLGIGILAWRVWRRGCPA
jgi:hypothetical protein